MGNAAKQRSGTVLSFTDLATIAHDGRPERVTTMQRDPGGITRMVTRELTADEREKLAAKVREFERDNARRKAARATLTATIACRDIYCCCGCWLTYAGEDCPNCQYVLLGAVG